MGSMGSNPGLPRCRQILSWRLGHAETRSSAEHGRVVTSLHTASPTRGRVHAASLARLRGSSAGTLPQAAFCFPP